MEGNAMNTQDSDIVVNAAKTRNLTTYSNALKAAGLVDTYKGPGPFTVFAPTDQAFSKLPPGELEALLKDKEKLSGILNFHATHGALLAQDMVSVDIASIQGGPLTMKPTGTGFTVNDARGARQEIEASNGVIHGIDTVMKPRE